MRDRGPGSRCRTRRSRAVRRGDAGTAGRVSPGGSRCSAGIADLDHEAAAGLEVRGDVLEARDLLVLRRQVHDRVEDEVGEPRTSRRPVVVAKSPIVDVDRLARLASHAVARPSPPRGRCLDTDAASRQRQSDAAGADPELERVAVAGQPGQEVDRRLDHRRREHLVATGRRSAPPPARRSSSAASTARLGSELDAVPGRIVDRGSGGRSAPLRISLRKLRPALAAALSTEPRRGRLTTRTSRLQPPGSGRVPSGIGCEADAPGPASQTRRVVALDDRHVRPELALELEAERVDEERDRRVDVGDDVRGPDVGKRGGSTGRLSTRFRVSTTA